MSHAPANPAPPAPRQYAWIWVVCLLGLDYFSTLAYQPSITFEVAGRLGPLATAIIVLMTLAGVVPVYCYLAGRSPGGAGSIGMLENVVRGWRGKTLVLLLLGFAATDFVMLKTISLADAAEHLHGAQPHMPTAWHGNVFRDGASWLCRQAREQCPAYLANLFNEQMVLTLLLGVISFLFWFLLRKGFNNKVMVLAVPLVATFLLLNGLVIGLGIDHLFERPDIFWSWLEQIRSGDFQSHGRLSGGWGALLLCLLYLPHVALGLSGFEMSMILMPQVRGASDDNPAHPKQRIANTRKVLITAALVMSVYLLTSALVTTLLIPEAEQGRSARYRSLAYLAHGGPLSSGHDAALPFCGPVLGAVYDIVTVLVLCFAGTSVMTALASLLPQFLLRFGMEMRWANRWGVLLILFAGINLLVTLYFQASVDAQRDAYTTSVLVLMTCAAITAASDRRHHFGWRYFVVIAGILTITTIALAVMSWSGVLIASLFILAIIIMSVISRAWRVDELRTLSFAFKDDESKLLWDTLKAADFPVLVPHRPGKEERDLKEDQIRRDHQLSSSADVVFVEIHVDDPSDFYQNLLVEVIPEAHRFVIKVTRCVSVAHAIAAVALEMSRYSRPPGLHFGWTDMDMLTASWTYLAFGQGNIPWKVRELMVRAEPDPNKRPRVIVG